MVVVPTQVRLGVGRASQIGVQLHSSLRHHVPQFRHCGFRALFLRQDGHALSDARHGLMGDLGPLAAPDQRVRVQLCPQRLGLLKAEGDLFQDLPVGASNEDPHLVQPC